MMMKMIKIDNNDLVNDDVRHPQLGGFFRVEHDISAPAFKSSSRGRHLTLDTRH